MKQIKIKVVGKIELPAVALGRAGKKSTASIKRLTEAVVKGVKAVKKSTVAAEKLGEAIVASKKAGAHTENQKKKRAIPPLMDHELLELGIRPPKLYINYNVFKKTMVEKVELKNAKAYHNLMLRKAGFDPRIRINISEPAIISSRI